MYSLEDLLDSHKTLMKLRIKNAANMKEWSFLHHLTKQLELRILQYLIENTEALYDARELLDFYINCFTRK